MSSRVKLNEVFKLKEDAFQDAVNKEKAIMQQADPELRKAVQPKNFGLLRLEKAIGGKGKDVTHAYEVEYYERQSPFGSPIKIQPRIGHVDTHFGGAEVRKAGAKGARFYKILSGDELEEISEQEFEQLREKWLE